MDAESTATEAPPAPGGGTDRRRPATVPRGLLWVLALAVVAMTAAGWMVLDPGAPDPRPTPSAGDGPAPPPGAGLDLTGRPAPDTAFTTFDGATMRLADLRGAPVVLNFWGSWCPPCIEEMPAFEQVHRAYGDRVRFVGLDVHDTDAGARAQARMTGVTYALGFDRDGSIATAFGLINLPATVLIDRDGTVVHTSQATALTAGELTALVEDELRPAPPPAAGAR